MKSLILHDGESDADTNALHDFLNGPVKAKGHDWEGHNSGIYIQLDVAVGDTILVGKDGGLRIIRKDSVVGITALTFPEVHAAMLQIEYDNGAHHVNRIAAMDQSFANPVNLQEFTMPYSYGVDKLVIAEVALARLREISENHPTFHHPHVYETIVVGEEGERNELMAQLHSQCPGLPVASQLLNDWFNDWWGGNPPIILASDNTVGR